MLKKLIKRFYRVVRSLVRINWVQYFKLRNHRAGVVLWIRKMSVPYLGSDAYVKDMGILNGLLKEKVPFTIFYGNKIGRLHNKKIFITLDNTYNVFGFDNYVDMLNHIIPQLEVQGNMVFPNKYEASYWENKAFMHKQFRDKNVSEPQTTLYSSYDELKKAAVAYPYLIKAEHSCSSNGLFKIASDADLEKLMNETAFLKENETIIVQQLINMRKDLRVILVNGEIVLHYWRINNAKEWKPTSTSYGSSVDFEFFPEQWRAHVIDTFNRLKLTTGAFDITWQNDDLSTEPLYLEVSPVFQPNPKMDMKDKPYAYYKKGINPFYSWDAKYVDVVFDIKHSEVKASLHIA